MFNQNQKVETRRAIQKQSTLIIAVIGNSSKITITINLKILNALLQLLSYFCIKKRRITITLAITIDYYNNIILI